MNLKELRKQKGLTQTDAAVKCGVSLTAWRLWEKGVNSPLLENKLKIKKLEKLPDKAG